MKLFIQMVLPRLFISFFPLFLFAYKSHFYSDINLFSDKLYFDVFSDKWNSIPSKKTINRALSFSRIGIEYKSTFTYGIKFENDGVVKINRGFIESWYYASNDFNTLLKRSDIGYYITTPEIYGILNYAEYYAFYLKKEFFGTSFYLNFLKGKRLDYIKVIGNNTKNRFIADLEYVYTGKNFITDNFNGGDFSGYGLGIDIQKRFVYKNYFLFLGVYNILGFIRWRGVNYMYYHFDSDTKYIGDDGYIHYKPFGKGFYKTDYNFFQRLPLFFKYNLHFSKNNFIFGSEGIYTQGNYFNVPYLKFKLKKLWLKAGYVLENKNFVYGISGKSFAIEVSNNLKFHSKFIKLLIDFNF